jgi:hypothetical protein
MLLRWQDCINQCLYLLRYSVRKKCLSNGHALGYEKANGTKIDACSNVLCAFACRRKVAMNLIGFVVFRDGKRPY